MDWRRRTPFKLRKGSVSALGEAESLDYDGRDGCCIDDQQDALCYGTLPGTSTVIMQNTIAQVGRLYVDLEVLYRKERSIIIIK